jgi:hypothetical protein
MQENSQVDKRKISNVTVKGLCIGLGFLLIQVNKSQVTLMIINSYTRDFLKLYHNSLQVSCRVIVEIKREVYHMYISG